MKNGISIVNDTGMGFGTKVFDTVTGQQIMGIKSITINEIIPHEPIIGTLEVFIDSISFKNVDVETKNIDLNVLRKSEKRKILFSKIFRALAKGFLN